METLKSYVLGEWHTAETDFVELFDPSTEEKIARASSRGIDFAAALEYSRRGGTTLRNMSFVERGSLLVTMSKVLYAEREALIELSMRNTGCTRKDAKFDLDGATGTLAYYGHLAKKLGDLRMATDGPGEALGRSPRFWGQHVQAPLQGAALLINAFNFPAWGFSEKLSCAFLAGVPVLIKPATSTAMVTEKCIRILVEADILPLGALSFICGSVGDLVDHLGPQDVLAFTGSASTGLKLRSRPSLLESSTRVNIEADSLNTAILGPDVAPGSDTWDLFIQDVSREMTQKTGQKCTAVRRILVAHERVDEVQNELISRLSDVVVGNPGDSSVSMGPLATRDQLDDVIQGVGELGAEAEIVFGSNRRVDGKGASAGRGYFYAPVLLRRRENASGSAIDDREVFGPVATLIPFSGSSDEAANSLQKGRGSLVTSAYADDPAWIEELIHQGAAWTGRFYVGSKKAAAHLPGSGLALPQCLHGGPGRAGGGAELGGLRGLGLYMQRVALQGDRAIIERMFPPATSE